MIISDPSLIDKAKWNIFVSNHPNGNIFQTPEMYEVCKKTKNYEPIFIAAIEDSEIVAILQAIIQKNYNGILGRFTARSIIFGGPLISHNRVEVVAPLFSEYKKEIGRKAIYTQIRNFYSQNQIQNYLSENDYTYTDHLNILLDLNVDKEALWNGFSRSRKKGIRKALSENFKFEYTNNFEYLNDFYNLLNTTYTRIGLPIPDLSHFIEIAKTFHTDNYKIFIIRKDNVTVVALFTLIYKDTMYGYYMGETDNRETIKSKPVDLLFWEVFKWSIDNNVKIFDWMGAGKPDKSYGVRDFKLQFGGELVNYGRYEKIHKPFSFKLAKIGLNIWKKMK